MTAAKPAPTAAEIAEARKWFSYPYWVRADHRTAVALRVLLSALDAAEARAVAAEGREKSVRLDLIGAAARGAQLDERLIELTVRAETAERERDEARAALKPFAEYAPACRALQPDDVILEEDADGINDYELTAGAFFTAADVVAKAADALAKDAPRG